MAGQVFKTIAAGIALSGALGIAGLGLRPASAQDAAIKIGGVGPLSGPASTSGTNWRNAFNLAIMEANNAGGIDVDGKPRKFETTFEDSQSKPEVGLSAAQKLLTRDNVDIFIGDLIHSSVTLAIMEISPSFPNKLFFSSSAVSGEINKRIASDLKKYANFYKFNFRSEDYASTVYGTITQFIKDGKIKPVSKTLAFVVEDSDFGKSIIDNTKAEFGKDGWTVVAAEIVPIDQADFFPQIAKLKSLNPGVLISATSGISGGIALVRQLSEQKLPVFHFAVNYPSQVEFKKGAGATKEKLLYTPMMFDPINNTEHKALALKLAAAKLPISGETASGYCNAQILLDAIKRAGSVKMPKIGDAMAKTDFKCAIGRFVYNAADHSPIIGPDYFSIPAAQYIGDDDQIVWPPSVATRSFKP